MLFGAAFLGIKAIEYTDKFKDHIVPGPYFQWDGLYPKPAEQFYSLYFAMTGLHALHMVIGLGIMTVITIMAWKRKTFDSRVLHAGRSGRPLLALRRHRLDFPVPAAVPDRAALSRGVRSLRSMSGHVAPKSMYYAVFAALMVGTALTVGVAFVDLGAMNNVLMLGIAITKALLVILFFMHVRWSTRLTWVVAASGFFWLLILFGLTMTDYLTRGWVDGTCAKT